MKCGACFCRGFAAPSDTEKRRGSSDKAQENCRGLSGTRKHSAPADDEKSCDGCAKELSKAPAVIVNQYEISQVLGEGAQAVVCLAKDHQGRPWAIKIFEKKRLLLRRRQKQDLEGGGEIAGGQVAREIAIMKKLDHPNIVRLNEILDSPADNKIYMVMEHVDGGPVMDDKEEQEPLSEEKARDIFRQLIKGLEYLHYHGIVHRDIKPSNLLLTRTGLLKISDFGISAICEPADGLASSGEALGTGDAANAEDKQIQNSSKQTGTSSNAVRLNCEAQQHTYQQDQLEAHTPDSAESVGPPLPTLSLSVNSNFCISPPYITPRTLDAAKDLDPGSEEYKRIYGTLYPPTPSGIDAVKHDDTLSAQIGTFAFFPPERCSGTRYKGKLADIWAAGVTLYMFLEGRLPFRGSAREELSHNIRHQVLEFQRKRLSVEAKSLLRKMLQKRASDRLSIQAIKRSLWVRRGGGKFGLSPGEANSIDVTTEDLNSAITEVDLSIGITPMVRSKSWSATPGNLREIRKLNRELNDARYAPEDDQGQHLPEAVLNLSLDTLTLSDNQANRPLSVPARQLRKERMSNVDASSPEPKSEFRREPISGQSTLGKA